jgi:hypothetical protein
MGRSSVIASTIPTNQQTVVMTTAAGTRWRSRPPSAAANSEMKTAAVARRPGSTTIAASAAKIAKVARKSATSWVADARARCSGS